MKYLQAETLTQKLQVRSGVASRALLYCECRFNLTTKTIMFDVYCAFKLKPHFHLQCTVLRRP